MDIVMAIRMEMGVLPSRSREMLVGRYGFHSLVDWRKTAEEVRRRKGVLEMERRSSTGSLR
jgi:hypothetical protein